MPNSQRSKRKGENSVEKLHHTYRGRNIEVHKYPEGARFLVDDREVEIAPNGARLFIDGQEVEIEQTENGVMSHSFAFKEFGSPFELAEELIKQWGEAKKQQEPPPDHPHHDHPTH